MALLPHHDGSPLYVSTQEPSIGDVVAVRVRIPVEFGPVASVRTRSNPDHEPRFVLAGRMPSAGTTPGWEWWEAGVEVLNPVHGYRFLISMADGTQWWLNATGLHEIETLDSEDFKLVTYPAPPAWAASSVIYQVFPDRFARSTAAAGRVLPDWVEPAGWDDPVDLMQPGRSRQLYGGDLDGVTLHLDHLERLGATLIYLTPFFPGGSNHRYDASSFAEVDPLLGGDDALVRLVEAAHARGFKVIGDLTANHSGDRHEWFRAAHRHPEAAESDFYYWLDDRHEDYESWLGVPSLPKLNWKSQELRSRFVEGTDSVVARWLEAPFHLDGWRIDVANMTGRLRDEDLNTEVRRLIRATMIEANPDTILLAESTNEASDDFQGDAWHGAMTYTPFTRPLWGWLSEPNSASSFFGLPYGTIPQYTGRQFVDAHIRFTAGVPWRTRLATMNALDTHDTPRFLTHARPGVLPVAFGLAVTLPGLPVVFAGDEFGLTGIDGEHSRTPMPWSTAADPAVASTIDLYAELIHLRTTNPAARDALNGGGMRWLHVADDVLVFVREAAAGSVLMLAARGSAAVTLPVWAVAGAASAVRLFGDGELAASADEITLASVGPSFSVWSLPPIHAGTGVRSRTGGSDDIL